jgi:hypothetical protein
MAMLSPASVHLLVDDPEVAAVDIANDYARGEVQNHREFLYGHEALLHSLGRDQRFRRCADLHPFAPNRPGP